MPDSLARGDDVFHRAPAAKRGVTPTGAWGLRIARFNNLSGADLVLQHASRQPWFCADGHAANTAHNHPVRFWALTAPTGPPRPEQYGPYSTISALFINSVRVGSQRAARKCR